MQVYFDLQQKGNITVSEILTCQMKETVDIAQK